MKAAWGPGQLIDANSDHHLWAKRFDRDQEDIFSVQDQAVRTIVATVIGLAADSHGGGGEAKAARQSRGHCWAAIGISGRRSRLSQFRVPRQSSSLASAKFFVQGFAPSDGVAFSPIKANSKA